VTRTPLSGSKGQRSRSPGRFTHRGIYAHRQLQRSAWERIVRGKLLLRCRVQARRSARRHEALRRPRRRRGAGAYRVATRTAWLDEYRCCCRTPIVVFAHRLHCRVSYHGPGLGCVTSFDAAGRRTLNKLPARLLEVLFLRLKLSDFCIFKRRSQIDTVQNVA